jgi:hypothetical protein
MYTALILAMAAAEPPPVEAIDYALPPAERSTRIVPGACERGATGEIVVCGRGSERHRLRDLPPPPGGAPRDGVVGVDLPFGRVEPSLETVIRPDGWIDKRVMVKLKVPF